MFKWLIGAVALVSALGGLLWLGNHVLDNAREDGKLAERTVWQAKERAADLERSKVEAELRSDMDARFNNLVTLAGRLSGTEAQINVKLPPMLAASPRYASTDCSLTPGVLEQLNNARALSGPAKP